MTKTEEHNSVNELLGEVAYKLNRDERTKFIELLAKNYTRKVIDSIQDLLKTQASSRED